MAEAAAAQQPVNAQFVGNAFVQQYYHILHHTPSLVHKFYQNPSKLGRPEEDGSMSITTTMDVQQVQNPTSAASATEVPVSNSDAVENGNNQEAEGEGYSIYIKGLPLNASFAQLEEEFKKFGPIMSDGIQIRSNRHQGVCFGFVAYEVESAVQKAIEVQLVFCFVWGVHCALFILLWLYK